MSVFRPRTEVGRKLTRANRVLVETAVDLGVEVNRVPGKRRRFTMTYGDTSYLIRQGYILTAYNNKLAARMCKQKSTISSYLDSKHFPVPRNCLFEHTEVERAWDWAKYSLPIVLKPNDGKSGDNVYVGIEKKEEFCQLYTKIADKYGKVLIEELKEGQDHRVLVVKGKVVSCLKRIPAHIIGDGISTVKSLIEQKNKSRKGPVLKHIKLDEESLRNLNKVTYNPSSIPNKGEKVYLRLNANISDGGDSYENMHNISYKIIKVIEEVIKSIPGLNVCGVDVLINDEELSIIEINGSPMIDIHYNTSCKKTVPVAKDIIQAMFPELNISSKK